MIKERRKTKHTQTHTNRWLLLVKKKINNNNVQERAKQKVKKQNK